MTSNTGSASEVTTTTLSELPQVLKKFVVQHEAKTLIGTMLMSKGVLVVLFSHRFNREFPLIVSGSDTAKVQLKVCEGLGLPPVSLERGGQA